MSESLNKKKLDLIKNLNEEELELLLGVFTELVDASAGDFNGSLSQSGDELFEAINSQMNFDSSVDLYDVCINISNKLIGNE